MLAIQSRCSAPGCKFNVKAIPSCSRDGCWGHNKVILKGIPGHRFDKGLSLTGNPAKPGSQIPDRPTSTCWSSQVSIFFNSKQPASSLFPSSDYIFLIKLLKYLNRSIYLFACKPSPNDLKTSYSSMIIGECASCGPPCRPAIATGRPG